MRSQMKAALVVLAVGLGLNVQAAWGSPLLVEFSGEIASVDYDPGYWGYEDPLDPAVVPGATFSGSLSYDPVGAVDLAPHPNYGAYEMGTSVVAEFAGTGVAAYDMAVYVANYTGYDQVAFWSKNSEDGSAGLPFTDLVLSLRGPATLFEDDSIPLTLVLDDFFSAGFSAKYYLDGDPPNSVLSVIGGVTTLNVIPEPSSLALLALGAVLAGGRGWLRSDR